MTNKGAAGEEEYEDSWGKDYDELGIPKRSEKKHGKVSRRNSSFSAKWIDTKYGRRLKIQVKENALWLSRDEARRLLYVILKELL